MRRSKLIDKKLLFILMFIILHTPLFSTYFGFPDIPTVEATWLTGWDYRKSLTLGGSDDGVLSDFLIEIVVHKSAGEDSGKDVYVGSNCEDDFGDIRFTESDETTELAYHRVSYTSGVSGTFMVEVSTIASSPDTTKIYVYYGKSGASTTSSSAVYMLFEDFSGNLASWTQVGDAFWIAGGHLVSPSADNDYDYLYKEFTKKSNTKVKVKFTFRANYEKTVYGGSRYRAPCIGIVHGTATEIQINAIRVRYQYVDIDSPSKGWRVDLYEGGVAHASSQGYTWGEDIWITTTGEYDGSTLTVNNDDGGTTRTVNNVQTTTWKYFTVQNRRSQGWIDDIRIWEIASDMPSYDSWGAEDSGSDPAPVNEVIGHNETRINKPCKFYSEWSQTGSANLTYSILEWDITGSYTEVANLTLTGQSDWANSTQTLPSNRSSVNYRFTAYNTDGNSTTASDTINLTEHLPTNDDIGHNETNPNLPCLFYSEWNQMGLSNLTYSIFEWDITGSYQQVANISLSGQLDWANSTQTLPTNRSSINYRFTTFNTDGLNTTASNLLTLSNSAPSATTLEITNPTDGIFIMAGSGTYYTLNFVGTDSDGGSDISTLHGSLIFDDTHRLNISLTETTITFPEGGDYVDHGKTTITTSGNTKTANFVLSFKETTPIVNEIDGYLKVTDASSATSGWTSFSDIISTMLYEEDSGGGGVNTSPPSGEDVGGEEEGVGEENPKVVWWREPEEYLIEVKNPLNPTKTINLIPIPWDWTHAQKMSFLFILWLLLFFLSAYILDQTQNEKKDWKDAAQKKQTISIPKFEVAHMEYADPSKRKKGRK